MRIRAASAVLCSAVAAFGLSFVCFFRTGSGKKRRREKSSGAEKEGENKKKQKEGAKRQKEKEKSGTVFKVIGFDYVFKKESAAPEFSGAAHSIRYREEQKEVSSSR